MCPVHHRRRTNKRSAERLRFVTFRIKCFIWTLSPPSGPHSGFGFASDISETGAGIYSELKLSKGAPVSIALEGETLYRGVVAWCNRHSFEHRVYGASTTNYRLGINLIFESESERQRYLSFFEDLQKRATFLENSYKF